MDDKVLYTSRDDITKSWKSSSRGKGGGGGRYRNDGQGRMHAHASRGARGSLGSKMMTGASAAQPRQAPLRVNVRPSAFTIAKSFRRSKKFPWRHDLLDDSILAAGLPRIETGTKLHVTNLDQRVSNDDIRELFSEIGELKRYAIHYDKKGQPSGSAEVLYAKRNDAYTALKRYNNVKLDGRPIKIEIVSPKSELPVTGRVNVIGGTSGRTSRKVVMMHGGTFNAASVPANRSGGQVARGLSRNGSGRGRGQARAPERRFKRERGRGKKPVVKSAEQLDKELEKYHAEAMQI